MNSSIASAIYHHLTNTLNPKYIPIPKQHNNSMMLDDIKNMPNPIHIAQDTNQSIVLSYEKAIIAITIANKANMISNMTFVDIIETVVVAANIV